MKKVLNEKVQNVRFYHKRAESPRGFIQLEECDQPKNFTKTLDFL